MKNPTSIQIAYHLTRRLRACKVPTDARTPYTDACLTDRARMALEDPMRELFFEHAGDIWVPTLKIK